MYREPRNKSNLLESVTKPYDRAKLAARSTLHIHYSDGSFAVRYHDTDVFTRLSNGNIILNSNGFRTKTTKDRINEQLNGLYISQTKGIWWIGDILFYDGIEFDSNNNLMSERKEPPLEKIKVIKRKIAAYVKLIDNNLPTPNGGDCWMCSMFKSDDTEHLHNHLDEKYLHGSILVNAMRERGYSDSQIGLHYQMGIKDTFKRAVRRYLTDKLVPLV